MTTKTLKNGDTIQLVRISPISWNPEAAEYLKIVVDRTAKLGFCSPKTSWDDNKVGAVVMKKDGKLIGILAYKNQPLTGDENQKILQILIGGVDDEYQKHGAYRVLHKELENLAKENGYNGILSYVRTKNKNMMNTLKSLGKEIITVTCYKKLDDE